MWEWMGVCSCLCECHGVCSCDCMCGLLTGCGCVCGFDVGVCVNKGLCTYVFVVYYCYDVFVSYI